MGSPTMLARRLNLPRAHIGRAPRFERAAGAAPGPADYDPAAVDVVGSAFTGRRGAAVFGGSFPRAPRFCWLGGGGGAPPMSLPGTTRTRTPPRARLQAQLGQQHSLPEIASATPRPSLAGAFSAADAPRPHAAPAAAGLEVAEGGGGRIEVAGLDAAQLAGLVQRLGGDAWVSVSIASPLAAAAGGPRAPPKGWAGAAAADPRNPAPFVGRCPWASAEERRRMRRVKALMAAYRDGRAELPAAPAAVARGVDILGRPIYILEAAAVA